MAVVTTNSTDVAANLARGNVRSFAGRQVHSFLGKLESVSGDSIGSQYRLVTVPSTFIVTRLGIAADALGGSCAADIGIYEALGGAVVDADEFASAVALSSAVAWTNVLEEAAAADISKLGQPIWERIGLTSQPLTGKSYDIVATLTAASAANGTITMIVEGIYL